MQTDPNWSNFLYNPTTDTINLLDFGAAREFEKSFTTKYINVIKSAIEGKVDSIIQGSIEMGFLTGMESPVPSFHPTSLMTCLLYSLSSNFKTQLNLQHTLQHNQT